MSFCLHEISHASFFTWIIGRTCFFVLGLISSTPQGAEILDDYQWEATLSPLGLPTGLCVPLNVEKFISVGKVFGVGMLSVTRALTLEWG